MATHKITFVNHISDKGYPTHDKKYHSAHEAADKAEKKLNPKMYKAENKAVLKMVHHHPHELMATHDKHGNIKIEKKFKRFKQTLVKHETTEWQHDPGRKK